MSASKISLCLAVSTGVSNFTSMDDLPAVQVGQAVQHALCNLSKDLLSSSASKLLDFLVDTVQASALAELHCDRDRARRLVHEGSVVAANVLRCAVFVEVELANDLLLHIWIGICGNNL